MTQTRFLVSLSRENFVTAVDALLACDRSQDSSAYLYEIYRAIYDLR